MIERKDFHNLHWTRRPSSRRDHGKLWSEKKNYLVFLEEEENDYERITNLLYVKKCCSWKKNGVQTK